MQAVILAGGLGMRLRGEVPDLPKSMAPILGKPFLEILLSFLEKKGFKRIILSLGYKADNVISYFQNSNRSIELVYVKESQPLGTGGAIRAAIEYCSEDHVFVFNGDTFLDLEISEVEALWQRYADPIIVGRHVIDTMRYGSLNINHGRVTGFKPSGIAAPGLISAGCYVLPTRCLASYKEGTHFSLELDFLEKFVHETKVRAFVTNGYFIDIGIPSDYRRAQDELRVYLK